MYYTVCGLPGFHGMTPFAFAYITSPTGVPAAIGNGTQTCSLNSYNVTMGPASTSRQGAGGVTWTSSLSVSSGNLTDAWGLQAWMTDLNLQDSSGTVLSPAGLVCTGAQFSSTSCSSVGGGWYVALASSTGGWLDVYGLFNSTPSWAFPNTPLYSNDSLVLVLTPLLSGKSLTLMLDSSTPGISIMGSADF